MVVRVIGKANNFDIVFQKAKGDRWQASIPRNLSGKYVIEIFAYDAAGNMAFTTKALLIIDVDNLCAHLIMTDFYAELIDTEYNAEFIADGFYAELIVPNCSLKEGIRID